MKRGRPNKQLTRISVRLPVLANCFIAQRAADSGGSMSASDIINAALYWYADRKTGRAAEAWGQEVVALLLPADDRVRHPNTACESRSVRIPNAAHELYAAMYLDAQRELESPLVRLSVRGLYSLALGEWFAWHGMEFEGWNTKGPA